MGVASTQQVKQFHEQLGASPVDTALAAHGLLAAIEAKENREAEEAVGAEGDLHTHSQNDPVVSPTHNGSLAAASERVPLHAGSIDFASSLARQGVIPRQIDGALLGHERQEHTKEGQPQLIQAPAGLGEEAIEAREVLLLGYSGSEQHVAERAPPSHEPTGNEECQCV